MTTTASPAQTYARVEREKLREALRSVELAVSSAAPFVRLSSTAKHLELRTFGDDLHLRVRLPLDDVDAGLEAAVVPQDLKKALGAFAAEDELELGCAETGGLAMVRGKRRISLPEAEQTVPAWPKLSGKRALADCVAPAQLARDFELALLTAGDEEFRPILCSVLVDFDEAALISTDSYRLQRREAPLRASGEEAGAVLLSRQVAKVLAKDLRRREHKVSFTRAGEFVQIKQGPVEIVTRPVTGQFPQWRKLLAGAPQAGLDVDRERLADALKAVAAIAGSPRDDDREPLRVTFGAERLELRFRSLKEATLEEEIPAESWQGEPIEAGFSHRYLLDAIKVLDDERIELRAASPSRPALICGEQAAVLQMPIRLSATPEG